MKSCTIIQTKRHNQINQTIKSIIRMQYGKEAIDGEEFFVEGKNITELLKL
jgi:hypothetical protein